MEVRTQIRMEPCGGRDEEEDGRCRVPGGGTQAAVDKLGHLAMVQGIGGISGRIPRTRGSVLPFLIEIGSRAAISRLHASWRKCVIGQRTQQILTRPPRLCGVVVIAFANERGIPLRSLSGAVNQG